MTASPSTSVAADGPAPGGGAPPILALAAPDVPTAVAVLTERRADIEAAVLEHGAVTVRGLPLATPEDVAVVGRVLLGAAWEQREAFTERHLHAPGVYSSAEWPPDQPMCMHHELSYLRTPPPRMVVGCLRPAESGGITALADATRMLAELPPPILERFRREGWRLDRHYNTTVGVKWQQAFGVDDPARAEAYFQANDIEFAWLPDGGLRTRQWRPAVVDHPVLGTPCWFNQIAFLNEWTLDAMVREYLIFAFGPDGLPFNTRYGNGDPIEEEVVAAINATYESLTVRRPWERADLLVIDNIRTAHSREPYTGKRETVVMLGDVAP
ncbi:TauD/TfdA family dioxygenase [Micromonospora sp. DT201]|uniref:TauD/TfdA family dioxygenase n=1 Tax=Micromonospora sp. DT201 TaxID=3393442 RepID=UPI003CFA812E